MVILGSSIEGFDFEGFEIRDYTPGFEAGSSVAEIVAPAGIRHSRAHSTLNVKLYWVLEGTVDFEIGGVEATLAVGDLPVVPRGTSFTYAAGDAPAGLLLVHTPPFSLEHEIFEREA
jgi:mannose-6-phosphate isomerase-like protein (cupin superfamily)